MMKVVTTFIISAKTAFLFVPVNGSGSGPVESGGAVSGFNSSSLLEISSAGCGIPSPVPARVGATFVTIFFFFCLATVGTVRTYNLFSNILTTKKHKEEMGRVGGGS